MIDTIIKTCTSSALLAVLTPAVLALPTTATYVLDEVWLLPHMSHPWEPAQQMTGPFEWTYEEGDSENGSGQFIDLSIPWYNPSVGELNINVDLNSLKLTLPRNFHDLGVDLTACESSFGVDAGADADGDGDSEGADLLAWQHVFTPAVPERSGKWICLSC